MWSCAWRGVATLWLLSSCCLCETQAYNDSFCVRRTNVLLLLLLLLLLRLLHTLWIVALSTVVNVLRPINVVALRLAQLVLRLVTVGRRVNHLGMQPATHFNSAWPSIRG